MIICIRRVTKRFLFTWAFSKLWGLMFQSMRRAPHPYCCVYWIVSHLDQEAEVEHSLIREEGSYRWQLQTSFSSSVVCYRNVFSSCEYHTATLHQSSEMAPYCTDPSDNRCFESFDDYMLRSCGVVEGNGDAIFSKLAKG